ncbi:hypothetical protein IWQ62_003786 [Dispira parvispora]|uniref:PSP proline-rich domain-containing protein n=1 Tax=Dispira parvispora TaxID=1520584 RepID=A0A9W8E6R6_9FUNG|nr:hypothetical protein IWQ62_003786 [Dispira parvispora]
MAQEIAPSTKLGTDAPHASAEHASNPPIPSRNKKRRQRRKKKSADVTTTVPSNRAPDSTAETKPKDAVVIDYKAPDDIDFNDPLAAEFATVFQKYTLPGSSAKLEEHLGRSTQDTLTTTDNGTNQPNVDHEDSSPRHSDEEDSDSVDQASKKQLSKNRLRRLHRMTVAELKQKTAKPEVVDWVDTTAPDPILLAALKSYRNSVPVPQHWSRKRKYLQGKRGLEKAPFDLPDFIKDTGIQDVRESLKDKESAQQTKTKMRERIRPKIGKVGVDYQKLHDAFFVFQTKPPMTIHGDLYYEGKEFETKAKEYQPGELSEELRTALNIPPLAPFPWLINMQRYGPPPNYPNLVIPGLNAPIPQGAQWGFHPGGWGKAPVDEFNRPLYGNVFQNNTMNTAPLGVPIERELWGEFESEESASEEESEAESMESEIESAAEEAEAEVEAEEHIEPITELGDGGVSTVGGLQSVPAGLETPSHIELRKGTPQSAEPHRPLYQVLQQQDVAISGFMGSQHKYAVAAPEISKGKSERSMAGSGVQMALDPSEMESLTEESLRARYEATVQGEKAQDQHEDFSDLVAEHTTKQARKRKNLGKQAGPDKTKKKYRDFKF